MIFRFTLLLGLMVAPAIALAAPLHIVLDPGHGGHDAGATRGKITESKIVLAISRHLQNYLENDPRFRVTMTRETHEFLRLSTRAKKANQLGADLFLSIHANASPDRRARGLEVYFQNQLPPDEESMFLASLEQDGHKEDERYLERNELDGIALPSQLNSDVKNMLKDMVRSHRIRESSVVAKNIVHHWSGSRKSLQHTILQAPFFVVSNVNMPSVLVEVGFVSNKSDIQKLTSRSYQRQIAQSLYKSLILYKDSIDK